MSWFSNWFGRVPDQNFKKEYVLPAGIIITIVGTRTLFDSDQMKREGRDGYCHTSNPPRVWILGHKLNNGKIRIDHNYTLGHEMEHVLSTIDGTYEVPQGG